MSTPVDALVAELDGVIESAIANAPRSLQTRIGPSEMGIPCDLRLGYKLLGHPETNAARSVAWKPFVGTAVHDSLKLVFSFANYALPTWAEDGIPRYHVEEKVVVGQVNGDDIDGSCDMYVDGTVVDWKIVGGPSLRKYKAEGPGDQYRKQAHLYGWGWAQRGFPVENVAVYFLPRDQEWRQRYFWSEPFDEALALETVSKVDGIAKLVGALGVRALPLLRTAPAWCRSCPWLAPGSTDLARGCPGHPDATAPDSSLTSLIA
ncbi:hypothetical protein Ssi03_25660 [Sphaerisporangium siamense]|uniref:PD-(D/E)XK endonuclease-like domain-containing protein n=1 Tax=Sphaerisporangium siamense TaxID=795645 RepID=A0A7W7D4J2_9ACTN|nr:hypothetical protein [Sphaerisporangium siamense]MBB4700108.1 hypothetical protein [Sphaerisporangium siamense]GII84576.1 hypothetical protein Ssi03_25660 [Sphaerisporangium siamense]